MKDKLAKGSRRLGVSCFAYSLPGRLPMPSRRVSKYGFRPFCLPTERGSAKGKHNARRTAHRQSHQGGTQQAGAHHHLARPTARLLAPKRLQDLQPPLDLHRLAPQNLRPAGLRFLQVLFGLQEQQEKRMNLRGFVAAFPKKSYFCRQKSIGEQSVDVQNLVMTFRASQPVDFFFYASIAVILRSIYDTPVK